MRCEKPVQVILFEGDEMLDANEDEPQSDQDWIVIAKELVATGDAELELTNGTKFLFEQGLDHSPLFMDESAEEAEMFVSVRSPAEDRPRFVVLPLHDEQQELDEPAVIEAFMHASAAYGEKELVEDLMEKTVQKILAMRPAVMLVPLSTDSPELNDDEYAEWYTIASSLGRAMIYNGTRFSVREQRVQEALSRAKS